MKALERVLKRVNLVFYIRLLIYIIELNRILHNYNRITRINYKVMCDKMDTVIE